MDINVPIDIVLKVEVPMEDYQNEVRETCVKELENHKTLVKRHVKKQIGELLTEDALRQYVGEQLAILVKRDALQAAMSVQNVIRRQIDEQVSECVRSAVRSAIGKLDGRIDRSINRVVSDAVVSSISRNKLRSMVLDRVNQQDKDGIMSRSIDELELSVRAMTCIKAENISTIGELAERTETELIKIRGLGRKSLREIIEVLGSKGLTLIGSNA